MPADAVAGSPPSDWVVRWADVVAPPGAAVLDLACGSGRHAVPLAGRGARVTAVDRDTDALARLAARAADAGVAPGAIELLAADLESGPWPLAGRRFDAVVVTNYLWRPRFHDLLMSVAPGGWLLYETFADGQQALGRPTRPEFLLRPRELLARLGEAVPGDWRVVAYEDRRLEAPLRCVQRVLARRGAPAAAG